MRTPEEQRTVNLATARLMRMSGCTEPQAYRAIRYAAMDARIPLVAMAGKVRCRKNHPATLLGRHLKLLRKPVEPKP